ncbi:sensor histidine kinase [Sulfurovum lithotrophicum]|uniref:sensor histidine kinase n=1 Tax=Sulfurovum lithotrophicum TaxID=206403 RepID=UPI000699153A|nr:HAMP domain-containing sensor histidine kinase [Sulfurovum lithotrophicum]
MKFVYLFLSFFLTFHLFLHAKTLPSDLNLSEPKSTFTSLGEARLVQNMHTDDNTRYTAENLLKMLFPFALLVLLILLSLYAQRQYNKRLRKQMELAVEELRHKDELLLQQQRMAAMGEMLSMISHQWKQPLGAINSAVIGVNMKIASGKFDLAQPTERKKFLAYLQRKHDSILEYVRYLSDTTDDFRNFFNPYKSKATAPLSQPVENALMIIQKSLEGKGIQVITELNDHTEIMMYENEIIQVILNLLKNSEDIFLEKNIQVPKIIIATLQQKQQCLIRIYDNGGGIHATVAKKIFEPYFSTKEHNVGTGLGLYMSRIIMEDHHNGSIKMRNKNGGGLL